LNAGNGFGDPNGLTVDLEMIEETQHSDSSEQPASNNEVDAPVLGDNNADDRLSGQQSQFLTGLLFIALLFLTGQWLWMSFQRPEPLSWQHGSSFKTFFRVDINNATWIEWIQLKGIGETTAHRIVADRKINGPFASIEDLQRVDGIGPATLDQLRPWLTISHDEVSKSDQETGTSAQ